jgi:hypothetical protein
LVENVDDAATYGFFQIWEEHLIDRTSGQECEALVGIRVVEHSMTDRQWGVG